MDLIETKSIISVVTVIIGLLNEIYFTLATENLCAALAQTIININVLSVMGRKELYICNSEWWTMKEFVIDVWKQGLLSAGAVENFTLMNLGVDMAETGIAKNVLRIEF